MRILMIDDDQTLFLGGINLISSNFACRLDNNGQQAFVNLISRALKDAAGFTSAKNETTKLQTQYI
jgi:hypothetical protein